MRSPKAHIAHMAEFPIETCLNFPLEIKCHPVPKGFADVMPTRRYTSLSELTPITSP